MIFNLIFISVTLKAIDQSHIEKIQGEKIKLLGGSALDRNIEWLKIFVATSILPEISDADIANVLG